MNGIHLQNRQNESLAQMIPFIVIATLAVVCRFLSRKVKRTPIGADDHMIVIGLFLTWAIFVDAVIRKSSRLHSGCFLQMLY